MPSSDVEISQRTTTVVFALYMQHYPGQFKRVDIFPWLRLPRNNSVQYNSTNPPIRFPIVPSEKRSATKNIGHIIPAPDQIFSVLLHQSLMRKSGAGAKCHDIVSVRHRGELRSLRMHITADDTVQIFRI